MYPPTSSHANDARRQPRAITNLVSRRLKGLKIERLLQPDWLPAPLLLLEIGMGSGAVQSAALPFDDSQFDMVISNHAIEHISDQAAQLERSQEIHRILKPAGIGHLAALNRWMPDAFLNPLKPIARTLIYRIEHST